MTEELSTARYCELCGVEVEQNVNLKRFGKLFGSDDHTYQYVNARQRRLGLKDGTFEKEREEPRRRRSWSYQNTVEPNLRQ